MSRLACKLSAALLSLAITTFSFSAENYPGGIAELRVEKKSSELPEVKYGLQDTVILDAGSHWRVIIGLALDTLPGSYLTYVKPNVKDSSAFVEKFQVEQKVYPIHEKSPGYRVQLLHQQLSELNYSNSAEPEFPLLLPVNSLGQWQDNFGHLYQDPNSLKLMTQNHIMLETTALAPVLAPQNALVTKITIDENQLSTIYLDHGRGLFSIISGLRELSVSVGNGVVAGAVLGKLPTLSNNNQPSTLYWQCILNGVLVNPMLLTKLQP